MRYRYGGTSVVFRSINNPCGCEYSPVAPWTARGEGAGATGGHTRIECGWFTWRSRSGRLAKQRKKSRRLLNSRSEPVNAEKISAKLQRRNKSLSSLF